MNHRADKCVALLGVARHQRLCSVDQHVAETVVDIGMDDDALHPDTALPRLVESAENDTLQRIIEIGIRINDHRGITAELEHHFFLAAARLEIPADIGRSSERE